MNLLLGDNSATGALHDLVMVNGVLQVTGNLQQRIDCRLRTIKGEWWLDLTLGVDWFLEFFKKAPDMAVCRQAILVTIQQVSGVTKVTSLILHFDRSVRTLSIIFTAEGVDDSAANPTTMVIPI